MRMDYNYQYHMQMLLPHQQQKQQEFHRLPNSTEERENALLAKWESEKRRRLQQQEQIPAEAPCQQCCIPAGKSTYSRMKMVHRKSTSSTSTSESAPIFGSTGRPSSSGAAAAATTTTRPSSSRSPLSGVGGLSLAAAAAAATTRRSARRCSTSSSSSTWHPEEEEEEEPEGKDFSASAPASSSFSTMERRGRKEGSTVQLPPLPLPVLVPHSLQQQQQQQQQQPQQQPQQRRRSKRKKKRKERDFLANIATWRRKRSGRRKGRKRPGQQDVVVVGGGGEESGCGGEQHDDDDEVSSEEEEEGEGDGTADRRVISRSTSATATANGLERRKRLRGHDPHHPRVQSDSRKQQRRSDDCSPDLTSEEITTFLEQLIKDNPGDNSQGKQLDMDQQQQQQICHQQQQQQLCYNYQTPPYATIADYSHQHQPHQQPIQYQMLQTFTIQQQQQQQQHQAPQYENHLVQTSQSGFSPGQCSIDSGYYGDFNSPSPAAVQSHRQLQATASMANNYITYSCNVMNEQANYQWTPQHQPQHLQDCPQTPVSSTAVNSPMNDKDDDLDSIMNEVLSLSTQEGHQNQMQQHQQSGQEESNEKRQDKEKKASKERSSTTNGTRRKNLINKGKKKPRTIGIVEPRVVVKIPKRLLEDGGKNQSEVEEVDSSASSSSSSTSCSSSSCLESLTTEAESGSEGECGKRKKRSRKKAIAIDLRRRKKKKKQSKKRRKNRLEEKKVEQVDGEKGSKIRILWPEKEDVIVREVNEHEGEDVNGSNLDQKRQLSSAQGHLASSKSLLSFRITGCQNKTGQLGKNINEVDAAQPHGHDAHLNKNGKDSIKTYWTPCNNVGGGVKSRPTKPESDTKGGGKRKRGRPTIYSKQQEELERKKCRKSTIPNDCNSNPANEHAFVTDKQSSRTSAADNMVNFSEEGTNCITDALFATTALNGADDDRDQDVDLFNHISTEATSASTTASTSSSNHSFPSMPTLLDGSIDGATDMNDLMRHHTLTDEELNVGGSDVGGKKSTGTQIHLDDNNDEQTTVAKSKPLTESNQLPQQKNSTLTGVKKTVIVHEDESETDENYGQNLNAIDLQPYNRKWLKCERCEFYTTYPEKLRRHKSYHVPSDADCKFKCPYCKISLSSLLQVRKHERKHAGFKEHECRVCGAEVTDLNMHIRVHKDEKPFKCDICEKNFRHKNSLVRHLPQHKDHKPLKCGHCGKGFIVQSRLNDHIKDKHTNNNNVNSPIVPQTSYALAIPSQQQQFNSFPAETIGQTFYVNWDGATSTYTTTSAPQFISFSPTTPSFITRAPANTIEVVDLEAAPPPKSPLSSPLDIAMKEITGELAPTEVEVEEEEAVVAVEEPRKPEQKQSSKAVEQKELKNIELKASSKRNEEREETNPAAVQESRRMLVVSPVPQRENVFQCDWCKRYTTKYHRFFQNHQKNNCPKRNGRS